MTAKLLAFHVDLKRPMWRRDYLDDTVARLGAWGFNALLYEFEDKLRFARHPDLAHREAWSREQTADFADAARRGGLDVIPLIQTLGHAEGVVGKPAYAHLRETPEVTDQYDPTSDEAGALLRELLDEVIETFRPREFVHLGGDETCALGKSERLRPLVGQIGVGGLYLRHMLPLFEHVRARGLRPMIWADILLQHPEALERLPRDVAVVDWNYGRAAERDARVFVWHTGQYTWPEFQALPDSPARRLAQRFAVDDRTARDGTFRAFYHTDALGDFGFDTLTGSASRSAGDHVAMPRIGHIENIHHNARKGLSDGAGTIVTSWAVRHPHPELALASVPAAFLGTPDREAVVRRYTRDAFGAELPELAEAWALLTPPVPFSEAWTLWPAAKLLARGGHPFEQFMADLRAKDEFSRLRSAALSPEVDIRAPDWIEHARALTASRRAGYGRAQALLRSLAPRAGAGAARFACWSEAADLALFYADTALAVLHGRLPEETPGLLARLAALRETTRSIWAATYTAGSIEDELTVRYGLHEAALRGITKINLEALTCAV